MGSRLKKVMEEMNTPRRVCQNANIILIILQFETIQ